MTPTRLPRPGEVVELCRLCGAALELSVENPRRVCAACGEVNLPSDHSAGAPARSGHGLGPTLSTRWRDLVDQSRSARPQFWVTAVPIAIGVPAVVQVELSQLFERGHSLVLHVLLAGAGLLAITVGSGVALAARRPMPVPYAVMFWNLGLIAGLCAAPGMLMLIQLLLSWLPR